MNVEDVIKLIENTIEDLKEYATSLYSLRHTAPTKEEEDRLYQMEKEVRKQIEILEIILRKIKDSDVK